MKLQLRRKLVEISIALVLLASAPGAQAAPPRQEPPPAPTLAAQPSGSDQALVDRLKRQTGGPIRIARHAHTQQVRFIGASPQQAIAQPSALPAGASPEQAARGFLAVYGKLFGLQQPAAELQLMRQRVLADGRAFARFQQLYRDVPILGGELIVQSITPTHKIVSAAGEILPNLTLDTQPLIPAAAARQTAVIKIAKDYGLATTDFTASEPELWIYNPLLLGAPGVQMNSLVWRTQVTPAALAPIRELVLVDAHLGAVILNFNQIDTARNRRTYDAFNTTSLPGVLTCTEANPTCSGGDSHEAAAHIYAGATYDFYQNEHGRDSIDNAGMTLISTVHYGSNYANAFWDGQQMVYGDGYGFPLADDVVAHELTHGITDHESQLFYFYQSGAINESFSDVWGEFVDRFQATGNDTGDALWAIGEDISGLGAIRNMQNPPLFGDPDRMTSSIYFCEQSELATGDGDNGGVHINSGVNNKAAYLLTDGGFFNGYTVTGLGYTKVADLYYEVQTNLLTSAADYADLYDALIQACTNLGYSAGDCQEVQDAVNATAMNQQPTGCPAPHAPVCDAGLPTNLFFDDIESGGGNWTKGSNTGTAYWFVPHTTENLGLPGPYATSGIGNIWGFDQGNISDTYLAMKNSVALPSNAFLHFNHSYGFESSVPSGTNKYDGGVLEYSLNGGVSWTDAGPLITENGYNGVLSSGYGNPLGGKQAFSADSRGYISTRLNLNSLAGQNIRFRFRIGTDAGVYDYGWFVDDVRIYTCAGGGNTPPVMIGLPDQILVVNTGLDNAIDLWAYTADAETPDNGLTFTLDNTPDPNAGVSIDINRYVDISPAPGWTGQTNVTIRVTDPGGLFGTDAFQIVVQQEAPPSEYIYLPLIFKSASPGPTPGFWKSGTGDEFYVTTTGTYVDDFTIYIYVNAPGCGYYKIVHSPQEPIANNQFSFGGSFYASGAFNSATAASGTDGLNNFYIAGCGTISGGPWPWNAVWQSTAQPVRLATIVERDPVEKVPAPAKFYPVTLVK